MAITTDSCGSLAVVLLPTPIALVLLHVVAVVERVRLLMLLHQCVLCSLCMCVSILAAALSQQVSTEAQA